MREGDVVYVKTASVHESVPACDGQNVPGVYSQWLTMVECPVQPNSDKYS